MEKIRPLVSVIVPLYNYQNYIADCITSIKNQTYKNWELFVIDDCSTDGSYKIAKQFECDNITIMQLDTNSGYSTAKNAGIIKSNGELITCLDADDMFTVNSLKCRVRAIMRNNVPLIHANAANVIGNITLQECYKLKKFKRTTPTIHAQSVMLRRWVHQKYGLYDETLRSRSDKEMWWRLFGKGCTNKKLFKIQKFFIKEDVAYYRKHGKSMMANRRRDPARQKTLMMQLEQAYAARIVGITEENTRFLKT